MCSDGISFAAEILQRSIQQLSILDALRPNENDVLLNEILPCLASSICLIPSCIPTLSVQYAIELLPFVTRCAKVVDNLIQSKDSSLGIAMKEGEWAICVDSFTFESDLKGSSDDSETFSVLLERNSTQKSANDYYFYQAKSLQNDFCIVGASYGTRLHMIEDWCAAKNHSRGENITFQEFAQRTDKCNLIEAHLSLDGTRFEGVRFNVEKGSSERVIGSLLMPSITEVNHPFDYSKQLIQIESLLCLAVGHLSLILCSQTSLSDIDKEVGSEVAKTSLDSLLSASSILSRGFLDLDGSVMRHSLHSTWDRLQSGTIHSEISEKWKSIMKLSLLPATDYSMVDAIKKEDATSLTEQLFISCWEERMGSLSRICPDMYATAQKSIASAMIYHTCRLTSDSTLDTVSRAMQQSIQIMENEIREALGNAGIGVRLKSVCEDRCSLLVLISKFLFDFSCRSDDNQSFDCICDDIAHILKYIKSEADLDYIKRKINIRSEQSIMRCVGLRSLDLLMQPEDILRGVSVHVAVEAALVSLPRLLCPSTVASSSELEVNQGLTDRATSSFAGCTASIQTNVHFCVRSIYGHVGSVLAAAVHQVITTPTLGLLSCYVADIHTNDYNDIILDVVPSLALIMKRCREHISNPDSNLLTMICKEETKLLLETSVGIFLVACAQLSHGSVNSSQLVELLSKSLFHEISETIPLVTKDASVSSARINKEAVEADCIIFRNADKAIISPKSSKYSPGHDAVLLSVNRAMQSDSPATVHFSQLLDVLHIVSNAQSFIEIVLNQAGPLLSSVGLTLTGGHQREGENWPPMNKLPLRFRHRVLRLLRPILDSMDADPLVIRQLFCSAGTVVNVAQVTSSAVYSEDDLLVARSSISLLRHLYRVSMMWRKSIHQQISVRGSNELSMFYGVLAFFGGAPGSLYPGEFAVIEPELASTSSTVGSTKSRTSSALSGLHLNAKSTSGSGAEEIVAGLCRHYSLCGVISSIDSRHGSCELILSGSTDGDSSIRGQRTTTRALHVSASNICSANELPLCLDVANLPAIDIFGPLSDIMKPVLSAIKSISNVPSKPLKLDLDTCSMMGCSMGLRSTTVLISEPKVLQKFVADESSGLRLLFARA